MTSKKGLGNQSEVSNADLVEGLRKIGLKKGQVVLVHSAMRTVGHIEGGAQTFIEAILTVLGSGGTLVVPTFTLGHEAEEDPIIDPVTDRSEMGVITETARLHPDAVRNIAFRHSFAAIGRRAKIITEVDPSLAPFDLRSAFGVMLALNTQVVLLGLTYSSSTSHHFAEWVCDVPYRHKISIKVRLRRADRSLTRQAMIDYQPKSEGGSYYGTRGPDFNRLGKMLEDRVLVGTTFIGNAAVRRFSMRDLVDLALVEAAKDHNIFRSAEGETDNATPLDFGKTVLSPEMLDGAGRLDLHQWCVRDVEKLSIPN